MKIKEIRAAAIDITPKLKTTPRVPKVPTEGIGCHQAGEIRPFDPQSYLGERNLRPIDRTSRLLLVAAGQALAASGWPVEAAERGEREIGLVLGTTFCSVRTIAEFDRRWRGELPDGWQTNRYNYRVVRLWQEDPDAYLAGGVNLVPLAPLGDVQRAELPGVLGQMKASFERVPRRRAAGRWR